MEARGAVPTSRLRELNDAALRELELTRPSDRFAEYKHIATGDYRVVHGLVTPLGRELRLKLIGETTPPSAQTIDRLVETLWGLDADPLRTIA